MKTGTKEWADKNENFLIGCQHDCKYCYAKAMRMRFKQMTIDQWKHPIVRKKQLEKNYSKTDKTIMFPSTHDIHPDNLQESAYFLKKLLKPGNRVLIVSKPHVKCIDFLCNELHDFREQITFRFTIGSVFDHILEFWEPCAPKFNERLESLAIAFEMRFKTSVSAEPMLDDEPGSILTMTKDYITDSIWFGKMNSSSYRCKLNGHDNQETMEKLEELKGFQSDSNIKAFYDLHKNNPIVKWKDSIKKVIGEPEKDLSNAPFDNEFNFPVGSEITENEFFDIT